MLLGVFNSNEIPVSSLLGGQISIKRTNHLPLSGLVNCLVYLGQIGNVCPCSYILDTVLMKKLFLDLDFHKVSQELSTAN